MSLINTTGTEKCHVHSKIKHKCLLKLFVVLNYVCYFFIYINQVDQDGLCARRWKRQWFLERRQTINIRHYHRSFIHESRSSKLCRARSGFTFPLCSVFCFVELTLKVFIYTCLFIYWAKTSKVDILLIYLTWGTLKLCPRMIPRQLRQLPRHLILYYFQVIG